MKRIALPFLLSLFLLPCNYAGTKVKDEQTKGPQPIQAPSVVYVTDFPIEAGETKSERGILSGNGPLRRRRGEDSDPAEKAENTKLLMNVSLREALGKAGLNAKRLMPDDPQPKDGWIIRGEFVEVDEGNRVRRAVIGFGSGKTDMEISVNVCDVSISADQPFLVFGTGASSGRKPGAILLMNPYVAAAKFVMSKNASKKDIQKTGACIAKEIVKYMKEKGLLPGDDDK